MREISNEANLAKSPIFAILRKVDAPIPPLAHKLVELINICLNSSQFAFWYLCLISIAVGTVCKSERSNLNGLGGGWIAFHWVAIKVLSSPSRLQNANMVHCIKDIKPPDWQMSMAVYKICHHMEVSWIMGWRVVRFPDPQWVGEPD